MARIRVRNIERANFKCIEFELYNYLNTLKEYQFLVAEIIDGQSPPSEAIGASRGIEISRPTEDKAIRLSSAELLEIRNRIYAIQYMIRLIEAGKEPRKRDLLELKYFQQRLSDYGIMEKLHLSERTFFRWRNEIVGLVASKLGWRV
jgi:RinA family phage transcriptional activator